MPSLNPSREQLAAFAEQMPDDAPILMLNLLRYREAADYPPGSTHSPCSGREAYRRYSRTALAKVQGVGGRVELLAAAQVALIAPDGDNALRRIAIVRIEHLPQFAKNGVKVVR